jgi:hypothetical protein
MAIFRKVDLQKHIVEFDERCTKLRAAIKGSEPHPNVWDQFSLNPDDFKRDYVELHLEDIRYKLEDFKASLKILGTVEKLKTHRLKPNK